MKTYRALILLALLGMVSPSFLQAQTTESYTFTTNRLVPDGNAAGLSDVRTVNSAIGNITSLKVRLKLTGEYNGDLYGYLRHSSGFTMLLNRPGKTASNQYGYPDSGLDVTFQTGAANGDIHMYQNVLTPLDGSPLTGVWEPDGRTADPANVTDVSARSASLTNFNGLNAAGQWTLYLADVDSGGTNMLAEWGVDISGAAYPTLAWANPANIVYGTALNGSQLNATATYNSASVPGVFTYSPAAGTVLNAGSGQTLSVTFTPTDATRYLPVSTTIPINVLKASLAVAANDASRVYGSANPALTGTVTGAQNGDNITAAFITTADVNSAVGSYAITPILSDPNSKLGNYNVTTNAGTLSVTRALITVTAANKSKAYGAALPAFTATYSGFVLNQTAGDLTGLATLTTTATATSDVGSYPIAAAGATSPNYSFNYVDGTLNITQALTAGALVASANPALPGANVTFTATLGAVAPGAGTPSGTVNFRIDGSIAGSGTLSGGVASFTVNSLAHGSHTVVAEYSGNLNFIGTTAALTQDQVINTAPVAGSDSIERYPTQGVKVRISMLLANDSDADGDTLNITVNATSANGGAITVSGGWVFYTPAAGFTNADSFTYTITDGHGGSATGTVTVAIKVDDAPAENLAITSLGNGSFRINGDGIPNRTYRLQFTTTLSPANWQDISGSSVKADDTGKFEYTDTPGEGTGFYRSVYP